MRKMKNLITVLLLTTIFVGTAYSQKVILSLTNPRLQGGYFKYDLRATIPSGQNWAVGSCNIRVNFTCTPSGAITVKPDNPVENANPNISGANGYQNMTTTSILNGTAISLNILTFNTTGFYHFTPGTYLIGTLRWNAPNGVTNTTMTFRVPPSQYPTYVSDSLVILSYPTGYNVINPTVTGIIQIPNELPTVYQLSQNYPNPFNPITKIRFDLPKNVNVKLTIYDMLGREIETLVNEPLNAGRYEVVFDASKYTSGVYYYRLNAGEFVETKKMILVK